MSDLSVTNTFVAATTAVASQVNQNFSDIVDYINNRDDGTATWDNMNVTATVSNPVTIKSNQATTEVAIDNTATDGDPQITFKLSGSQAYVIGIDDSDLDIFKFATSGITTNVAMQIPSNGGSVQFGIGSAANPGVTFIGNAGPITGSGMYMESTNVLGFSQGGNRQLTIGTNSIFYNTLQPLLGIIGTTTNDSAAAGSIGEYVAGSVAAGSAVSSTGTTQYFDIQSIILTAGDWDVTGAVVYTLNGATVTAAAGGIGTSSGNTSTGLSFGDTLFAGTIPVAANDNSTIIPAVRKSLASTTTIYLKANYTFSAGTPKAYGRISARRVR